jgi:hypothetical protein
MGDPPLGTVIDAAGEPPPPAPTAPPLPPRIVIWLLRAWWGLAAFVGAAILGGLLVLPLAITSPDHYWDGVQIDAPHASRRGMLRRRLWRPTPFAPEGPARPDRTVPGPESRGFLSPY